MSISTVIVRVLLRLTVIDADLPTVEALGAADGGGDVDDDGGGVATRPVHGLRVIRRRRRGGRRRVVVQRLGTGSLAAAGVIRVAAARRRARAVNRLARVPAVARRRPASRRFRLTVQALAPIFFFLCVKIKSNGIIRVLPRSLEQSGGKKTGKKMLTIYIEKGMKTYICF